MTCSATLISNDDIVSGAKTPQRSVTTLLARHNLSEVKIGS